MLIAHRGFGENRMIDFEKALKTCDGVEFDLRLTKDKKIIIFHDSHLSRFGRQNEKVSHCTYDEILALPHFKKHPEDIPPLFLGNFLLKCAPHYKTMDVEIKGEKYSLEDYKIFETALHELRDKTKANIIVSSFNKDVLWWITSLDHQKFKRGYLISSWWELNHELFVHFDYIAPFFESFIKKANIKHYESLGKPAIIWTLNYQSEIKAIKKLYSEKMIFAYVCNRNMKS